MTVTGSEGGAGKEVDRSGGTGVRPWLKSYPPTVPAEIGPLPYASLPELMLASCRKFSDRTAFTSLGRALTYAELDRVSEQFAAYLQGLGLSPGARIAIMLPNILQYPVALLAVLRAGFVVVNVNPLYSPRELEFQLADSGAEAILILENFAATLQAVAGKVPLRHVIVTGMGDLLGLKGHVVNFVVRHVRKMVPAWDLPGHIPFRRALAIGRRRRFTPANSGPDDLAILQYTGGTTGRAKGAKLLHRNILANVMQNRAWADAAYAEDPRPEPQTFICALPLYHVYALTVNALAGIEEGGNNLLIPNPRDMPAFLKELRRNRFHVFVGINTLFNALLNREAFHSLEFSSLRLTLAGGMAVQPQIAARWKEVTGCSISEGYGLSETSPVVAANIFGAERTGTIGLPLPSTEIAIRDDANRDLPFGEAGEIVIRGPQVMPGYWNRPEETALAFTPDGFFRSGDVGIMDEEGYIRLVDRKKDMILVSGFNVYPNEIEEVVASHPGVLEAAAVGVPDAVTGEMVKLFVVRKDPELTIADLRAWCRENLTNYKRPRIIEFRDELPKSNIGKILRRALRENQA